VEERKRWISEIQAAHAAVAPAAAASIAQSLAKQNASFAALDAGSKARLHAMFIDFVAQAKTAPRQKASSSATVRMMDACCFDPSNGRSFCSFNPIFHPSNSALQTPSLSARYPSQNPAPSTCVQVFPFLLKKSIASCLHFADAAKVSPRDVVFSLQIEKL
jgi:hypothetical protein